MQQPTLCVINVLLFVSKRRVKAGGANNTVTRHAYTVNLVYSVSNPPLVYHAHIVLQCVLLETPPNAEGCDWLALTNVCSSYYTV